jgi:hypothetical protein
LEEQADFLLILIVKQPDLTLDEIVAAMAKQRISGSRSAAWRFFERRSISFKKLCTQQSNSARLVARARTGRAKREFHLLAVSLQMRYTVVAFVIHSPTVNGATDVTRSLA